MILAYMGFSSIPGSHPLYARNTPSREDHGHLQTLQTWGSKVTDSQGLVLKVKSTGTPRGGQPRILIQRVWVRAQEAAFLKEFRLYLVSLRGPLPTSHPCFAE